MKKADSVILVFDAYSSFKILGIENALFNYANIQTIGAFIQNMILKAKELEIGSLWFFDIFASYQQICEEYYKNGQLIAAITLDHPAETEKKLQENLLMN